MGYVKGLPCHVGSVLIQSTMSSAKRAEGRGMITEQYWDVSHPDFFSFALVSLVLSFH